MERSTALGSAGISAFLAATWGSAAWQQRRAAPEAPNAPAPARDELTATVMCRMDVRAHLQVPTTAEFSGVVARPRAGHPGAWVVNGAVTAMNVFDAPLTRQSV